MTESAGIVVATLHASGATTVLVRGEDAPATTGTEAVVALDPGLVAFCSGDHWQLPLYVAAWSAERRVHHERFDNWTVADALDRATELVHDRELDGVWFRHHAHLARYFGRGMMAKIESRLAAAARETDATFVTWTGETTPANDALYDRIVES